MAVNSTEESALLRLPAEIRNSIYEYAVTEEGPVLAVDLTDSCVQEFEGPTQWANTEETKIKEIRRRWKLNKPGIVDVCCQMRREALPLYFAANVFIFKSNDIDWNGSVDGFMLNEKRRLEKVVSWWVQAVGEHIGNVRSVGTVFGFGRPYRCEEIADDEYYMTVKASETGDATFAFNDGKAACTRDRLLVNGAKRMEGGILAGEKAWEVHTAVFCCRDLREEVTTAWRLGRYYDHRTRLCPCYPEYEEQKEREYRSRYEEY